MRMRIQREELHEIEKHFSGFDQNSFENLLKEQNLLASKLYKLSYTQILSALENRNPHSEFSSVASVSAALRALDGQGRITRRPSLATICYLIKTVPTLLLEWSVAFLIT